MTRWLSLSCLGLVLVCLGLVVSGCGTAVDMEDVGFVVALGVDSEDDGKVRLWLEVAEPGMGVESLAKQETLLASTEGDTLYDAFIKLETRSSRNLTLGHVRTIVIGERLARAGLRQAVDALMRDATLRLKAWVLVTPDPVEEVLSLSIAGQPAGMFIGSLMQREAQRAGAPSSRIVDLVTHIEERGVQPLIARVGLARESESAGGGGGGAEGGAAQGSASGGDGSGTSMNLSDMFVLNGAAVFKGDKMVGWLDARQSAAAVIINSRIQGYEFIHKLSADGDESIGVNLMSAHAEVSIPRECLADAEKVEGCTVEVKVNGLWGMRELISDDQFMTEEGVVALNKSISVRLKRDTDDMLRVIQTELGSDVIGIGEVFRQRMAHSNWKKISGEWDTLFQSLNIKVIVNVAGRRRGQILRSLSEDKAI